MTPEERNTAILKEGYRRWSETKGGSADYWASILADEVDFRSLLHGRTAEVLFTRPRRSKAEVESYLRELTANWEMIDYVVDHFIAQGDRIVAVGHTTWRFKATGKICGTPKVDVWRFDDAGKAVEFYEMYDSAALLDATRP